MTKPTKREDDAFLRRVVWLLLGLTVSSAGGWIYNIAYSQSELDAAIKRIDKLELIQIQISRSMTSIDKGVAVLIALAEERNKQQKIGIKRQNYIFGEQKRRKPLIAGVWNQMQNERFPTGRRRKK